MLLFSRRKWNNKRKNVKGGRKRSSTRHLNVQKDFLWCFDIAEKGVSRKFINKEKISTAGLSANSQVPSDIAVYH